MEVRNTDGRYAKSTEPWNKNLKGDDYLKHYVNGHPKGMLGKKAWNKGKKLNYVPKMAYKKGHKPKFKIKKGQKFLFGVPMGSWNKGIKHTKKSKKNMRLGQKKRYKNHIYKSTDNRLIRRSYKFKQWRKKIFERDNYTCKICKKRSGKSCSLEIHPHHLLGFAKYPKYRFEEWNGLTLCKNCHLDIHKKKGGINL